MILRPINNSGYQLFHEGMQALSQVEANGLRIDTDYLERAKQECKAKIAELKASLMQDEVYEKWRRKYGAETNLGSREQLGEIIFKVMKQPCHAWTESTKDKDEKDRRPSTDDEALRTVKLPFVTNYLEVERWKKALGTYLKGIERETINGYLHPVFNLHIVATFRSSSCDPNFQNIPIRRPEVAKLIRTAFIPRGAHRQIVEFDFKGIEVSVAACYNHDPVLIEYVSNPKKDMHGDMGRQIYIVTRDQMTKMIRYAAKNGFVFAEFYGNWYKAVAKDLWMKISELNLTTADGTPLKEHLREQGIRGLGKCDPDQDPQPGTFEYHLKEVEEDFWGRRFKVYSQWKKDWNEDYLERGYFDTLTGFRCLAMMDRKQAVNYPIQGCLAGESRVLTKRGLIPINKLVGVHTEVWTGFRWAEAVGLDRGMCQRADIQLSSGITIHCDTRHKLKNERNQWVDFKDLKVGDYAALPRTPAPLAPSKDMTWWFVFGFILGDGCISNTDRRNVTITGGETKKEDLKRIRDFLVKEGYEDGRYGGVHLHEHHGKYTIWIGCKRFADFLESYGFRFGVTAHTKSIPLSVWDATPQQRRDFLEGLWRSDGSRVQWQERNLGMCNKSLLQEVQILSASVGFDSHLRKTSEGWKLSFSWRGFNKKAWRRYPKEAIYRQVSSVDPDSYGRQFRNQWITDKRNFLSSRDVTQYVGGRIIKRNGDGEAYRYDKIEKITTLSKAETTYTMSVNDPLHQFVADGVIHKNSAFHCLLWSLIRVQKLLRKYKMKSLIVGQIHDSMIMDVLVREMKDVMDIVRQVTMVDLAKHWSWIAVPMRIECEAAPPGRSWYEKKEISL